MQLAGTPSDQLPDVIGTGTADVGFAFISMSAREPDGRDAEYVEWHSLDHVPRSESYFKPPPDGPLDPGDYFHVNSVALDDDGNLLVSARNTSTVYKIDRRTGEIIWRLGGKKSDFRMGPNARFWWQHDAQRRADGTITMFDDGAAPPREKTSRALALRVDEQAMTATVARAVTHPEGLL